MILGMFAARKGWNSASRCLHSPLCYMISFGNDSQYESLKMRSTRLNRTGQFSDWCLQGDLVAVNVRRFGLAGFPLIKGLASTSCFAHAIVGFPFA